MNLRITTHPSASPARSRRVAFTFEGRTLHGYEGEPVATALHAAGVRVLSRSFKYHRPRGIGLTCGTPSCPGCQLTIDGHYGVPGCATPLRGGESVRRERAWPGADWDLLGAIDRFSALVPAGFQFRLLRGSPRLAHLAERLMGVIAGGGRTVAAEVAARALRPGLGERRTPLAVVGAGVAGLAAALAAAGSGLEVVLVDQGEEPGGALRAETRDVRGPDGVEVPGFRLVADLAARARQHASITVLTASTALGWYEGGALPVDTPDGLLVLRPDRLLVATGDYDVPMPFPGNDIPGVMMAGPVQRLINVDRVRPGERAVVVAAEPYGYGLAEQLHAVGVTLAAVVDPRPEREIPAGAFPAALAAARVPYLPGHAVREATGHRGVRRLVVAPLAGRSVVRLACDTVVVAAGRRPAEELLLQRLYHGDVTLDVTRDEADGPYSLPGGVAVAGGAAGTTDPAAALAHGAEAGRRLSRWKPGSDLPLTPLSPGAAGRPSPSGGTSD
ncbi:FAD-dependent oxidoreductase [Microbispora siamensis]|uniref:Sarcosine oxidase subunit alpha n=1 Tax=Microbispora siamensis TaxID=564413 RepID=A0ABQ4GN50_9ACTN|nr:FAD-dependent oxidoreductase [Microbispora siamensis]GIH62804.1 sarcosine oxidase subunit alpha [Microbispora siamensis]